MSIAITTTKKENLCNSVQTYQTSDLPYIRRACELAARAVHYGGSILRNGITTLEIDTMCDKFIRDNGGVPACIGYQGYKFATCISVNNILCHGIPNQETIIQNGDLVNIDIVVKIQKDCKWLHGDTGYTFAVGTTKKADLELLHVGEKAMWKGISAVKPGNTIANIGSEVEKFVDKYNRKYGTNFAIAKDFCGHGIGYKLHEDPLIHNCYNNYNIPLRPGMLFTIEPIILQYDCEYSTSIDDKWTVMTHDQDCKAVQFEHTLYLYPNTTKGFDVINLTNYFQHMILH